MESAGELLKQVSIIVCTVDRLSELEKCLTSLEPFRAAAAEVLVVNNGPHPTAVAAVARHHSARVVEELRRGVSRARNAGVRAATGNIVAFLDDDSVADSQWLPLLVAPFRDCQVLAAVGCIFPQSVSEPATQAFDYLHRAQFPESPVIVDGSADNDSLPMRAALLGNANMAIRREVFERFGYFDTRLGRGTRIGSGEEPDLFLRILLGGGKIAVEPGARIFHHHSAEWRAVRRWAFLSGCAHTAILTKLFLQDASLRGRVVRYVRSRLRRRSPQETSAGPEHRLSRAPLIFGSLYGPIAFLLSGYESNKKRG